MSLCTACGEENPDRARFCLACGRPLTEDVVPAAVEERRTITVLFTDIVGSTATAEQLDPEDVRARLAVYYARVRSELEQFGGSVEKFIGDAVVAIFGAPIAHEDDPERAVRAALAVREAISELNQADDWLDLKIRTGVNTGEALVVLGAPAVEGEGMTAGDVMNTAARLQSNAPVDGIVVGEATYRATAHVIEYREASAIAAKGKAEPVPVWEVVGARAPPSMRAVSRGRVVGREAELGQLAAAWERVAGERCALLVSVIGEAGIGKSRLIDEFLRGLEGKAAIYSGRCLPYGEGITYWPVIEVFKDIAGIHREDDDAATARKLGSLIESLPTDDSDEVRTIAVAVSNVVGASTTPQGRYTVDEITRAELHWGIQRVFELLAVDRPLTLVFEDLHWADPTFLELLQGLAEDTAGSPILLLTSARAEIREAFPHLASSGDGRVAVELAPLSRAQGAALLAELVSAETTPTGPLETLVENAGGNPLFLEETVRMLMEAGVLEAGGRVTQDLAELPVATSVQALISSRLDRLPSLEKRIGQHASVVGVTFWSGAVAHVAGGGAHLSTGFDGLERRGFILPHESSTVTNEREYSFRHVLIRDVAYSQLPKGRRVELHVRFADWVDAIPGAGAELVEIAAYHLEQACRYAREIARSPFPPPIARAVDQLIRSGGRAERREGYREAERFYARALDVVGHEEPELLAKTQLHHAGALVALGELARASEELVDVADHARQLGRLDLRAAALVELGDIDQRQGRAADARRRLDEATVLAADLGDRRLQVRAAFVFAGLRADFFGAYEEATADLRRSVALAEELGDRGLEAEGHLRIVALLANLGRFAEAEGELGLCLALAGELGSRRLEAEATSWLSIVKSYRDGLAEAEALALQARDWLERAGDSYFQVQNLVRLAMYALADGDAMRAEEWLRAAVPIALGQEGWLVVEVYRFLVEALLIQGRLEDAVELAEFAGRGVSDEDAYARATVIVAEAQVAAASGDVRSARALFQDALERLAALHLPVEIAEARVTFGHALRQLGESGASRVELERAHALFTEMGAAGRLAHIEAELADLEAHLPL
jgi:class 3 adenylate cyclase/tetratricopeptide (TPR) repeat protein